MAARLYGLRYGARAAIARPYATVRHYGALLTIRHTLLCYAAYALLNTIMLMPRCCDYDCLLRPIMHYAIRDAITAALRRTPAMLMLRHMS